MAEDWALDADAHVAEPWSLYTDEVEPAFREAAQRLIDQISLRVETLDDLRDFHHRVRAEGLRLDRVVNHGSALGCYFFDPEGNRTEVFWVTGRPVWVPTSEPIDLSQPDEVLLAHVDQIYERERDVPMGQVREPVRA